MNLLRRVYSRLKSYFVSSSNEGFFIKSWRPLFELKYSSQVLECKRFSQQLKPQNIISIPKSKILIIAPHPDDELFGCGGTILKWQEASHEVHTVYLTSPGKDDTIKAAIKKEAESVSESLNAQSHFLDFEPGAIPESSTGFNDLVSSINPDIVFISFLLDDHDDHRRANHLLLSTLKDTGKSPDIWSYQIYSTVLLNTVIDITDEMDAKNTLMSEYKSVAGDRDWAHYVKGMNAMNCRFLKGHEAKYGENFLVIDSQEYSSLCDLYFKNSPSELYTKYYIK